MKYLKLVSLLALLAFAKQSKSQTHQDTLLLKCLMKKQAKLIRKHYGDYFYWYSRKISIDKEVLRYRNRSHPFSEDTTFKCAWKTDTTLYWEQSIFKNRVRLESDKELGSLFEFSLPFFSESKDRCIILVKVNSTPSVGKTFRYLYEKTKKGWKFKEREIVWYSHSTPEF